MDHATAHPTTEPTAMEPTATDPTRTAAAVSVPVSASASGSGSGAAAGVTASAPATATATVRVMTAADVPEVAEIRVRGWRHAYAGLVPASYLAALRPEDTARRTLDRLADPTRTGTDLVAVSADGTVLGWTAYGPDPDPDPDPDPPAGSAYVLHALYVRPDLIGTGLGRALLTAVHDALPPAATVTLWVLRDNARARRFYARAGYAPDGTEDSDLYDGTPVPELRYRRPSP
ncbi:GNAT family N-acetyltransferase [Streptomyces sp. NPDC097619]|uniref:GNAT family N-acetyltransferase n=1 Tax=Streptomyces sp. NPDC097619 TaxID=3157228 RepID=UPI00332ED2C8